MTGSKQCGGWVRSWENAGREIYQQRSEMSYRLELMRTWTREWNRELMRTWTMGEDHRRRGNWSGAWGKAHINYTEKNSVGKGQAETTVTFTSLSHIFPRTFLSPLEMHRKSARERNLQHVLANCLRLTGHLLDCECLQKTRRMLNPQCLLQSLLRSPKEGEEIGGLVYCFPRNSAHQKPFFLITWKIRYKYLEITLFLSYSPLLFIQPELHHQGCLL